MNDVETLSHVPHILNSGPQWFRAFGSEESPGTTVFTISGHVCRPLVRELPLGISVRQIVDSMARGVRSGRVKAVFPGVTSAVMTEAMLDMPAGFDSLKKAGSALGLAGFIVYDDTACMVQVAHNFARFLYVESCNQCPPCNIGSREISERLETILHGSGRAENVDEVLKRPPG